VNFAVIEDGLSESDGAYKMMHSLLSPELRFEKVTLSSGVLLVQVETAPIPGSTVNEPPGSLALTLTWKGPEVLPSGIMFSVVMLVIVIDGGGGGGGSCFSHEHGFSSTTMLHWLLSPVSDPLTITVPQLLLICSDVHPVVDIL